MQIYGLPLPFSSIAARDYQKGAGHRTQVLWRGTPDQIKAIEGFLLASGVTRYSASYEDSPARLVLYIEDAFDGRQPEAQVESTWSMTRSREHVDIWKHPDIVPVIQSLLLTGSYPAVAQLRANFDEAIRTGELTTQLTAWFTSHPALGELFERYAVHDDSFFVDRYLLRNTKSWPGGYAYVPDYVRDNKTMTSAQIQARFVNDLRFVLPSGKTWFTSIGEVQTMADGRFSQVLQWDEIDPDSWKYDAAT